MQFTGKLINKTEKIFIGANNTPKLSIILEEADDKQYKDSIMIDWIGDDKVALVENLDLGSTITVHFNLRTSEYNGRYYNNINGWRIEGISPTQANDDTTAPKKEEVTDEDFEDLPF